MAQIKGADAISLDYLDTSLQPAPTRRRWQASCTWRSGMAARRTVPAAQTERVLRLVREILGHDVLGAYEHGSAVLGGVQPTSDIDILVITGRLATLVEKRQLVEGLMAISAPFPPPGLERCVEVTLVAQAQVRPWRYPPSFDLQYGEWLRKRFERGDSLLLQAAVNVDLTTLLTIVLLGDQPLFGPPPGELLDPVLLKDCIRAMVSDIDVFMDEFEGDTRNLLLRLARIWQTVVTGVIDRKDRAAEWAQERLPPDYQQLMEQARAIYLGWQPDEWADLASEARAGADYMISQIRREVARRRPRPVLRLAGGTNVPD
jgi:predicted nucleotidyltransferase